MEQKNMICSKNRNKTYSSMILTLLLLFHLIANIAYAASIQIKKPTTSNNNNDVKLISLNFHAIQVRDLLRILAETSGKNILARDDVTGFIDINLEKVTWREALNYILKMKNLTIEEKEGKIFIAAKKIPISLTNDKNDPHQLRSIFLKIHYAKASEIAELLIKNHGMLSAKGNVIADPRTNSLLLEDSAKQLQTICNYIKKIDIALRQVLIEARIVYADVNFARELGLKFGTMAKKDHEHLTGINMDLPMNLDDPGHMTFIIAQLKEGIFLDLELSALESEGRGRIISNPKLVTSNHESAYIEAGDEVPYQEKTSSGATSIVFKKAVLSLKVTPEISTNNKVDLDLQLNQDKVTAYNVNGEPTIQTRQIHTHVLVANEETIVLGGIYEESTNQLDAKVPILSAIPVLGLLFQHKQMQTDRRELLIFITPKIINAEK